MTPQNPGLRFSSFIGLLFYSVLSLWETAVEFVTLTKSLLFITYFLALFVG